MLAPGKDGAGMIKNVKEILLGGKIYKPGAISEVTAEIPKDTWAYYQANTDSGGYAFTKNTTEKVYGPITANNQQWYGDPLYGWLLASDIKIGGVISRIISWLFPRLEAVA